MPSSKGKPTDPKLREEAKKEVMNQEKGGGKGNWSAYKAAEMAKVYEAKGGDYEDSGDNPNEAKKGDPTPKKKAVESGERKDPSAPVGEPKAAKRKSDAKADKPAEEDKKDAKKAKTDDSKDDEKKEPKKAKTETAKDESKEKPKKPKAPKKEAKPPAKGTREQPKRGVKK